MIADPNEKIAGSRLVFRREPRRTIENRPALRRGHVRQERRQAKRSLGAPRLAQGSSMRPSIV